MAIDKSFSITIDKYYMGYSPLSFLDTLTEYGGSGHSSIMSNVDVINGSYLTQGPGLVSLTGTLNQQIQFIMDKAVSNNSSYAIGTTDLYNISNTSLSSVHTITSCTEGESISLLKSNLLYFYNTATAGAIGKYDFSAFTDNWTTGLLVAPHASATKEDICLFANGRYVGVYIAETNSMTVDKLDFGADMEVADIIYQGGLWYILVNSTPTGTNRGEGQCFLYDGAALINTLTDETGVGFQKFGFIYRINGILYVAYNDVSNPGFIIGYINGKGITPLCRFNGSLPNFQQKTLFKNTILLISSGLIYSAGAIIPQLPYQLSQIADGGYATVGAIAGPFGDILVSSTDGVGNYKIAKFSGYTTDAYWKSLVFSLVGGFNKGYIDEVVVLTNVLGTGARADLTIETNQGVNTGSVQQITTVGKTRHRFNSFGLNASTLEDFRIAVSFANGSTTNPVKIRKIFVKGHWVEG